ncbi:MAG: Rqc2 family fibronectin-binding protein [Chloroflexota bacterium]
MYFDAITMAAVRQEIAALLGGGVERVLHPAELTVGLEIWAGGPKFWVVANAQSQQPRVHVTGDRLARISDEVSPLLLLLRKYVRDARLVSVEQPAWERVLELRFQKRDEDGQILTSRLIIEIMGRHSNIVLVNEEGRVLDAMKRVSSKINRYRTILPQQPYSPPPPQAKSAPDQLRPGALGELCLATGEASLEKALVARLTGVSPLVARELAYRATGRGDARVDEADWPALEENLAGLVGDVKAGRFFPTLGLVDGRPSAFAAYELRHFPERRPATSIGEALEAFFAPSPAPTHAGETGKAGLRATLRSLVDRVQRRREALFSALPRSQEIERLRRQGDLLLSYASQIPAGATEAELDGERVALDPHLSPVEQAQRFFHEYRRAKSGLEGVPQLLATAEAELSYLAQVETDLELADTPAEVEEVRHELMDAGLLKAPAGKRKGRPRQLPLGKPIRSSDGLDILVGRSARQNERVTFEMGRGTDVWLHARGVPGAHVLIKSGNDAVPERTLSEAAAYAAYYCQSRAANSVAVDYTMQRLVKRVKGGPPGLVVYSGEKTIWAKPIAPSR